MIGVDILSAIQAMYDSGDMPDNLSEGLIFLIPKVSGPSNDVRKWRPITLLNTLYKIMAKTLCNRLQTVLRNIIHTSQTDFLKDRSIMDNIFVFWEMTSLVRTMNEDMTVLFLDFEKAYDRVEWGFLEGVMQRMGFSPSWIRGVAATYTNAHSRVLVAGDVMWVCGSNYQDQFNKVAQ